MHCGMYTVSSLENSSKYQQVFKEEEIQNSYGLRVVKKTDTSIAMKHDIVQVDTFVQLFACVQIML